MTENGPIIRFKKIGESFENILDKEDAYTLSIGHSETQKRYRVTKVSIKDGEKVFEVKLSE